jgi:TonB family protein
MNIASRARSGIWLAMLCAAFLVSCASQKPAAPDAGAAPAAGDAAKPAPAPPPPPAPKPPRKLPPVHYPLNIDWYPTKAKQQGLTGRVLVGFKIDGTGKAVSLKVLKAEAPRILRNAALNFVTDATFDVSDAAFNPADPTLYAISVRFCIIDCGVLVGFPGYEDARITGSPLSLHQVL